MQQHHLPFQELELYLVEGILLWWAEWFDVFGVRLSAMVQSAHLTLHKSKQSTFYHCIERRQRGMTGIDKLIARHLTAISRHGQKSLQSLHLLLCPAAAQHL